MGHWGRGPKSLQWFFRPNFQKIKPFEKNFKKIPSPSWQGEGSIFKNQVFSIAEGYSFARDDLPVGGRVCQGKIDPHRGGFLRFFFYFQLFQAG